MAITDWVDDELRRSKDPGWTFTDTERKFLARIDQDRATIASERARADKAEQEVERLKQQKKWDDDAANRSYDERVGFQAQLSEARAEIARLREIMLRYVRAEDALSHYIDETLDDQLVPGVEADLAEEERDALEAIRDFARAALKPNKEADNG